MSDDSTTELAQKAYAWSASNGMAPLHALNLFRAASGLAEASEEREARRAAEAERDRARSLAATLEARLAQVEALAARWESARTWDDKPAIVDRCFGADLRGVIGPKGDA